MRITIVNTHDLIGGAERCSYDLAQWLHGDGEDVELIVGQKLGSDPFVRALRYRPFDARLHAFARHRLGWTDTTVLAPLYGCWTIPALRHADVYNVHNMHGSFWNFWTLPLLARRAPVVLTLHDEWLLTGDCAYTYDCERWRRRCGACPQARLPDPADRVCIGGRDATRFNLFLKRSMARFLPPQRVVVTAPSRWLVERAQESVHLGRFPCRVLPNGVDLDIFRPRLRREARAALGLSLDAFLVLLPAANLFDRRKNATLALDALRTSAWPNDAELVLVGRHDAAMAERLAGLPNCRSVGYVDSPERMARIFNAVDLTLVPSLADNLPYTALEAQASGCPVLGTRVGGMGEAIDDGRTGWLVDPGVSPEELAECVRRIRRMDPEARERVREAARSHAQAHFGLESFVARYRELFDDLVQGGGNARRDHGRRSVELGDVVSP